DGNTGAPGANAFFLNLWAPTGDTIRNGSGTIEVQADLYEGSTIRTGTYKWYIQDPSATTSNGGDADGGNGWRLITSSNADSLGGIANYNSSKISIPGTAIHGV